LRTIWRLSSASVSRPSSADPLGNPLTCNK
jgi:hypothetical protein